MEREYIKGKGILVGTYTEKDLDENKDRIDLFKILEETGLKYSNTEFIKMNGKIIAMKVYACTLEDCETFKPYYK